MQITTATTHRKLPLIGGTLSASDSAELQAFETGERSRLGLDTSPKNWLETMKDLKFSRSERPNVTILLGGLTLAHDRLVEGAFRGLGYRIKALECPNLDALRVGKEFGNRGQCNPTYFTVGNLVKYLEDLRVAGQSTEDIIANYVFLTAGACGPCRFGMYVTEYRKALRDAGFDGFRVVLFQQQGGLKQATGDDVGLEMNPRFFISLLQALLAGDAINALGYRIRPYELEAGATDRAIENAKSLCYEALYQQKSVLVALRKARKGFDKIAIDRTQPKPKVAVIGEFWAMTTEGDGNYHLQRFIEQEGGEVDIQIVTAWLLYNVWEVRFDTANRADLREEDSAPQGLAGLGDFVVAKRKVSLWAAEKALRLAFRTYGAAIGLLDYPLADMNEVARLAAPHYNNNLRGGEGHMEVGKVIMNALHSKSNLTLSVKPFGCMPSSGVSDGVQSLVTSRHPEALFCAVETSGEGAVNFQSRVQMFLFKARQAAQAELDRALDASGTTLPEVREWLAKHPKVGGPLHKPPHRAAASCADLVYDVARRRNPPSAAERLKSVGAAGSALASGLARALKRTPATAVAGLDVGQRAIRELVEIAQERFAARPSGAEPASVVRITPDAPRNSESRAA